MTDDVQVQVKFTIGDQEVGSFTDLTRDEYFVLRLFFHVAARGGDTEWATYRLLCMIDGDSKFAEKVQGGLSISAGLNLTPEQWGSIIDAIAISLLGETQ